MKPWFCNDSPHPSQTKWCGCHALPIALTKGPLFYNKRTKNISDVRQLELKGQVKHLQQGYKVVRLFSVLSLICDDSFDLQHLNNNSIMVATVISFWNSLTIPWLYPDKHKVSLTWINNYISNKSWSDYSLITAILYSHTKQWTSIENFPCGTIEKGSNLHHLHPRIWKVRKHWK